MRLLGVGNPKTAKGESLGWLTGIMHLAPGDLSGHQVCPMASKGCLAACLNTSGRGAMTRTQEARIAKTQLWFNERPAFLEDLHKDIGALVRKADREGLQPAVRLNGTSDIPWERVAPTVFETWPDVQFYDYTKRPNRVTPDNYHLTFSRSECNTFDAQCELQNGRNVAVVFGEIPETYWTVPVISGDTHDLRFLDPTGVVVGLTAKGLAKRDTSGFVVCRAMGVERRG